MVFHMGDDTSSLKMHYRSFATEIVSRSCLKELACNDSLIPFGVKAVRWHRLLGYSAGDRESREEAASDEDD